MSRRDVLARIPHLAVGEIHSVAVSGSGDVGLHSSFPVRTACGEFHESTLTTSSRDRVRCSDCIAGGVHDGATFVGTDATLRGPL